MCGIVGYVGKKNAQPLLVGGLKRLEYRGYDSAGVAEIVDGRLAISKAVGRITELEKVLPDQTAYLGIAHTRWATHGTPTEQNAHPHLAGGLAIVHNGIVENYQELRDELARDGVVVASDTDTAVLAHLIAHYDKGDLTEAVRKALRRVYGTFGLAVISQDHPGQIIAARRGSPLAIGYGDGEHFVASDASPLVEHTKRIVYLEDDELAIITAGNVAIETLDAERVEREIQEIDFDQDSIGKDGYDHFMLKEIHEQPEALRNVLRGRVDLEQGTAHLGGLNLSDQELRGIERIVIIACGTAAYAGLIGEYLFERLAGIPTEVAIASEWRYREPIIDARTLCLAVSQSGETADTLAAIKEAKAKGAKTLGLVNVIGSTIAREVDGGIYLHAGPEIGVASTKAFTNMVAGLFLLALKVGRLRTLSVFDGQRFLKALSDVPNQIAHLLEQENQITELAKRYQDVTNALYLGRGLSYPVALEGSHKLKEISYVHAEAYPAGEMKHGANALIDSKLLVTFVIPKNALYEKTKSNLEEVRAREGRLLAVTTEGNLELKSLADDVVYVPQTLEVTEPLLLTIPLQLFAYQMAVRRGTDVDKPRNLAKSVTVE